MARRTGQRLLLRPQAALDTLFRAALETMLDSVVIATAVRDDAGQIVDFVVDYINPVGEVGQRMAGEIVGRRFQEVWPAIDQSPIWAMYRHLVRTGVPIILDSFEYSDVIDGRPVSAAFDIRASRLGDGFIQTFRNVTDRVRMQADLRALEADLRQAERFQTVGQLTSGIAHDFKNMLGVIVGYTEMAQDISNDHDPQVRHVLHEIQIAADHAISLAGDLLNFSHRNRVELEAVDLNAVIDGISYLLRVSMSGRARVLFEPSPQDLPLVRADRRQLEQVLLNLAVNARDAMPDGGTLTISTSPAEFGDEEAGQHPGRKGGRYAEVAVSDTGTGMSADVSARIFDRFFSTKQAGQGTGLGLPTVQGIVADIGGTIEVDTAQGSGTTFRIYLPATSPQGA